VRLAFKTRGATTVLASLYQDGCYKARFPHTETGASVEVILINTSGGLTDGDYLCSDVAWQAGTTALCTTQAAERIYRSRQADATIRTNLTVAAGATACWLPQETIVFDGGRLNRTMNVELASGARLFAVESIVFGRTRMGETNRSGRLFDRWCIRSNGRPVFVDALLIDDVQGVPLTEQLRQPAIANAANCMATLVYAGDDCAARIDAMRQALAATEITAGASNLGPLIVVRILAGDSRTLQESIASVFAAAQLSDERPQFAIPRAWHC
jgi:urease accessory protein